MFTRPLAGDSRFFLLLLATDVIEDAGEAALHLLRRMSRQGRVDQSLKALEQGGLINRGGTGPVDDRLIRLTAEGHRALWGTPDPEALWRRRWDGIWRMAMFDVPESRNALRVRLRRKLRTLRFGWLQNSVWLSPDPVAESMEALGEERVTAESLLFMEGRPAGGETDAELVVAAWEFEKLAKLHAIYLKFLKTRPGISRTMKASDWTTWLVAEERAWREIVHHDPFLPVVLLPRDYAGRTAWEARKEALQSGARAFVGLAEASP